jgi:hypothetical protein
MATVTAFKQGLPRSYPFATNEKYDMVSDQTYPLVPQLAKNVVRDVVARGRGDLGLFG